MIPTKLLIFLAILLLLPSCKTEIDPYLPIAPFEYLPQEIGREIKYKIDTIFFHPNQPRFDTVSYYAIETITDNVIDNVGDTLQRIVRKQSAQSEFPTQISDVFFEQELDNQFFRIENNLKFLKIINPVREGKNWDGNAYFDNSININSDGENILMYKDWNYFIQSIDQSETIHGIDYPQVMTIQLVNIGSDIEYRYAIEKYARNIGLIYKELWILDTQCKGCCNAPDGVIPEECRLLSWDQKADIGFITTQYRIQ